MPSLPSLAANLCATLLLTLAYHLREFIASTFSPHAFFHQSSPKRALSLTLIALVLLSVFGLSLHVAFERALVLTEAPTSAWAAPPPPSRFLIVPTERSPRDYVAIPADFFQRHGSMALDLAMSSFCSVVIACAAALFYTAISW